MGDDTSLSFSCHDFEPLPDCATPFNCVLPFIVQILNDGNDISWDAILL